MEHNHTFYYKLTDSNILSVPNRQITMEFDGDVDLTEICQLFEDYLRAVGFMFDGKVEIVDEDDVDPEAPNIITPELNTDVHQQNIGYVSGGVGISTSNENTILTSNENTIPWDPIPMYYGTMATNPIYNNSYELPVVNNPKPVKGGII